VYIYIYGPILLCLNNTTHIHASRKYLNKLIGEDVPGSHCNMFAGHHWRLPQNMDTLMQTWLDPSPIFDVPNSIFNIVSNIYIYIYLYLWVNYNDLTATSLEIMLSKGNHPQMALIQFSDFFLTFTMIYIYIYIYVHIHITHIYIYIYIFTYIGL